MSADGYSGADRDDRKHHVELKQPSNGSGDIRLAETRDRTEYCETLHAADHRQTSADGDPQRTADVRLSYSAWNEVQEDVRANRPRPDSVCLSPERTSLGSTQAKVTASEREELRSLLEAMHMPAGPLAMLNVENES